MRGSCRSTKSVAGAANTTANRVERARSENFIVTAGGSIWAMGVV
jgi:hypothetical protein